METFCFTAWQFKTLRACFSPLAGETIAVSGRVRDTSTQEAMALPDLWLKLYWMIHFAFLAFAEGLAVPRY